MPKIHKAESSNHTQGILVTKPKNGIKKKVTFHDRIQAEVQIPSFTNSNRRVKRASLKIAREEGLKAIIVDKPIDVYAPKIEGNKTTRFVGYEKKPVDASSFDVITSYDKRTEYIASVINLKISEKLFVKDKKTGQIRQGYIENGDIIVQREGNGAPIRPDDQVRTPRNRLVILNKNKSFNPPNITKPIDNRWGHVTIQNGTVTHTQNI